MQIHNIPKQTKTTNPGCHRIQCHTALIRMHICKSACRKREKKTNQDLKDKAQVTRIKKNVDIASHHHLSIPKLLRNLVGIHRLDESSPDERMPRLVRLALPVLLLAVLFLTLLTLVLLLLLYL